MTPEQKALINRLDTAVFSMGMTVREMVSRYREANALARELVNSLLEPEPGDDVLEENKPD